MAGSGKEDLRVAAERLQRGIDRFGNGDLAGALIEFEEVMRLYPDSSRGPHFNAWLQKVQLAARVAPLDEEALRGIEEALDPSPKSSGRIKQPPELTAALTEERPRRSTMPPPTPAMPPPIPPSLAAAPTTATAATPPTTERGLSAPERERKLTPPPARERKPTPPPVEAAPPARERKPTPPPQSPDAQRPRRQTPPTAMETAATMQLTTPPAAPSSKVTREGDVESPWDPVPLTPRGTEVPPEVRQPDRRADALAELQAQPTRTVPPPVRSGGSSSTILGMPPLEPKMLTPQNRKRSRVTEDRPESVTREFRSATPTGPNLRPLDVPELTDEQIQSLLALDSPLLPEGRTTPEIELERIDGIADDSTEQRLIELEAVPTPLPHPTPKQLKNDTNPMGVTAFSGEFDPQQLTPTGVKPMGLKAVRETQPEDDPYADLNLLPLEVAPDLSGPDEVEEGGTNPTNPFIRGTHARKLVQLSGGSSQEVKLEDMPPLPTLPGARSAPGHPLGAAEAALQAGDLAAAVDACEAALSATGGIAGELARDHLPLVEQIYGAILVGADRVPVHGRAVAELEPRSAFLLSRLDGSMTVEDVLDVSGMPRLEALRTMALLVRRGAVVIK